jgi:hypothetical protein
MANGGKYPPEWIETENSEVSKDEKQETNEVENKQK